MLYIHNQLPLGRPGRKIWWQEEGWLGEGFSVFTYRRMTLFALAFIYRYRDDCCLAQCIQDFCHHDIHTESDYIWSVEETGEIRVLIRQFRAKRMSLGLWPSSAQGWRDLKPVEQLQSISTSAREHCAGFNTPSPHLTFHSPSLGNREWPI